MAPSQNSKQLLPFLAVGAFCFLSAMRDVLSEYAFKASTPFSPVWSLFLCSAVTVVTTFIYLVATKRVTAVLSHLKNQGLLWDSFWLSSWNAVSFLAYFLGVSSALGAGLTCFIEFTLSPFITVILATFLIGTTLERRFWIAIIPCLLGILSFVLPRYSLGPSGESIAFGLLMSLASVGTGGFYRVYSKKLLNAGVDRIPLLFIRFLMGAIGLGIYIIAAGERADAKTVEMALITAPFLFTLPIVFGIYALQRMNIKTYVLVFMASPIVTYLFSAVFGLGQVLTTDLIAIALIFAGVLYHENYGATQIVQFLSRKFRRENAGKTLISN